MTKCPNCGYEVPTPPYEYKGEVLKADLSTILDLLRGGVRPYEIARELNLPWGAEAMIAYVARRYGIPSAPFDNANRKRNRDIATRYLAGGVTMVALGKEHNISPSRTRQIILREIKRNQ